LPNLKHVNLVEFHELLLMEDTWFITMELVNGVDFLRWVAPSSSTTISSGSTTTHTSDEPTGGQRRRTPLAKRQTAPPLPPRSTKTACETRSVNSVSASRRCTMPGNCTGT
jgi:hypothetical protein